MAMIKGSRRHSGKICAATETLPETLPQRMLRRKLSGGGGSRMAILLTQRMLRRKLSGGGGSRMAILLMVVRSYHFDRRLVVGSPPTKK